MCREEQHEIQFDKMQDTNVMSPSSSDEEKS